MLARQFSHFEGFGQHRQFAGFRQARIRGGAWLHRFCVSPARQTARRSPISDRHQLRKCFRVLLATIILALVHTAFAQESPGSSASGNPQSRDNGLVVWCYDASRDIVTRDLSSSCRGSVVSDADAKKILDRRTQEIQKALANPPPALAGGHIAKIGTAFFVDDEGHLVTNNHVISDCKVVTADMADGKSLPVSIVAIDTYHDLALLHMDLAALHLMIRSPAVAKFRTQDLAEPGAFVAAIGYPEQGMVPRVPVITTGVLIDVGAGNALGERLAMRGDIRRGNSGSPIVDEYGLVIGVIDAKIDAVTTYRQTGVLPPDIGIGVSLPIVLRFLQTNGVQYQYGHDGPVLNAAQILDEARPYISRTNCWK